MIPPSQDKPQSPPPGGSGISYFPTFHTQLTGHKSHKWIKLVLSNSKIIEGVLTSFGEDYVQITGIEEIRDTEQSHLVQTKSVILTIPISQISFIAEYPEAKEE